MSDDHGHGDHSHGDHSHDDHDRSQGDHGHSHDGHDHSHGGHDHDSHDHDHSHGGHDHDSHDHDHSHGDHDHDGHHAHDLGTVGYAVVTVSSSRTLDDDAAGDAIAAAVDAAGDEVVHRELVGDDYDRVQGTVDHLVGRDDVDCVVTTGGTGVTPDDVTVQAVEPLLERRLPGFGELFRRLSYDEIGTMVVGTRAIAGIAGEVPVFCLPGSENAAQLGAAEIITAEAGHLAGLARRDGEDDEEEPDDDAAEGPAEVDGDSPDA